MSCCLFNPPPPPTKREKHVANCGMFYDPACVVCHVVSAQCIIISFYFLFSTICFYSLVRDPKHCDYHYDDMKATRNIYVIGKCHIR